MKGTFFAGIAMGALAGALLVESNPQAKKAVTKGKNMVTDAITKKSK